MIADGPAVFLKHAICKELMYAYVCMCSNPPRHRWDGSLMKPSDFSCAQKSMCKNTIVQIPLIKDLEYRIFEVIIPLYLLPLGWPSLPKVRKMVSDSRSEHLCFCIRTTQADEPPLTRKKIQALTRLTHLKQEDQS